MTSQGIVGTQTVNLLPLETRTLSFLWNTTNTQYCHNYTITATVESSLDSNLNNNILNGADWIKVRIFGDANDDNQVNMRDVGLAALAFGAYPGHARWNPDFDMNQNLNINLLDIALIAKNFGRRGTS